MGWLIQQWIGSDWRAEESDDKVMRQERVELVNDWREDTVRATGKESEQRGGGDDWSKAGSAESQK